MKKKLILFVIFTTLVMFQSKAHVSLLNPLGGESFMPGEVVNIQWQEVVSHNTLNWDLFFSSDGGITWDPLLIDGPLNVLNYQWVVPATLTTQGQIRIVQDNVETDYEDISGNIIISTTATVTGIRSAIKENATKIYPNPMTYFGILEFENPGNESHELMLYDTQGRIVRRIKNIKTDNVEIRRGELVSGLYIFHLHRERGFHAKGKIFLK